MPISTQEKSPRTKNFPKISLLKVENFQLQNFFRRENWCRPITFYKIFFLREIFLIGNGPLELVAAYAFIRTTTLYIEHVQHFIEHVQ
jgi:hypothetical protein